MTTAGGRTICSRCKLETHQMTRESFLLPLHLGRKVIARSVCDVGLKPSDRQHVWCECEGLHG